MLRTVLIPIALSLCLLVTAQTSRPNYGLPQGAFVVESRALTEQGHPDRALVLWMVKPSRHPRADGEIYTCPDETRGSYFSGLTRVSLVDLNNNRVINTVKIMEEYMEGEDSFDVPYRIHAGCYYHTEPAQKGKDGKAVVLWLRDYNGDGKPLEFALFDAVACMGLPTTLIGYSEKQDKVIQYAAKLRNADKSVQSTHWVDYLFSKKPVKPGQWKYEIDYRGRGGSLDKYEVHYNPESEAFEGTLVSVAGETN